MHHRKERVLQVAEAFSQFLEKLKIHRAVHSGREEKLCVFTVRRRQGRRGGRGNVGYLRCNQIVNGLESEADRWRLMWQVLDS